MGFEIDFLPVGEGEKCGDAIALRFGNLFGDRSEQYVIVIDGGTKESGEELVNHIINYYETDSVDLVVSTHPDQDHSSGLSVVIDKLQVKELWMHRPWDHSSQISNLITDGRITKNSIEERFIKSLDSAYNLHELAKEKNIIVNEPFAGRKNGTGVYVIGPTKEYYENLLPSFRAIGQSPEESLLKSLIKLGKAAVEKIFETLEIETLNDNDETSAENNSSTILFIQLPDHKILITGDAGITALNGALYYANTNGIQIPGLDFFQVPHHGSKRNLGPSILNYLIGPKNNESNKIVSAYISASKNGGPKHPSKRVINALIRRGARVFVTQGEKICHADDNPARSWPAANPMEFTPIFED